jgi:hypothetical protein
MAVSIIGGGNHQPGRVKKRFALYGVPIWSLWPNIRFLPSIVAEKNVTKNGHIQNVCSMCIKINKVHTFVHVYTHFSSHFSKQLLMTGIWYLVTNFIYVPYIVGNVFGSIRFLLPVCWLCWFLYTLNIYAHFSLHFSQQLLMAEIWYYLKIIITYLCL